MAERCEIVWSEQAVNDLEQILLFWVEHNKSDSFSLKLSKEILVAVRDLAANPLSGKQLEIADYRRILVRYYLIIYRIESNQIRILRIWNGFRKEIII